MTEESRRRFLGATHTLVQKLEEEPKSFPLHASGLQQYLQALAEIDRQRVTPAAMAAFRYPSINSFLRERGQAFTPAALDEEEWKIVRRAVRMMGEIPQIKQCYYNSQLLAASDSTGTLHYVEGLTWRVAPLQHAWCEIHGKVVDVTIRKEPGFHPGWETERGTDVPWDQWAIGTFDPDDREYWGVVFPDTSAIVLGRHGPGEPLIDDWRAGWPLLKTGSGYGLPDAPDSELEEDRP